MRLKVGRQRCWARRDEGDGEEEEEELGFEEMGLDPRLLRALGKRRPPRNRLPSR